MKTNKTRLPFIAYVTLAAFFLLLLSRLECVRRSLPGELVRFALGTPGAVQWVQDLSADVKSLKNPSDLRAWAQHVMDQYQRGDIPTNAAPHHVSLGGVLIPDSEVPKWIRDKWSGPMHGMPGPNFTISIGSHNEPRYVIIGWYLMGIVVCGDKKNEVRFTPFYREEPAPGIITYSLEK